MNYRRSKQAGGSYFFTVVTHQRQPILTLPENITRLRAAFKREMDKNPQRLGIQLISTMRKKGLVRIKLG